MPLLAHRRKLLNSSPNNEKHLHLVFSTQLLVFSIQ